MFKKQEVTSSNAMLTVFIKSNPLTLGKSFTRI